MLAMMLTAVICRYNRSVWSWYLSLILLTSAQPSWWDLSSVQLVQTSPFRQDVFFHADKWDWSEVCVDVSSKQTMYCCFCFSSTRPGGGGRLSSCRWTLRTSRWTAASLPAVMSQSAMADQGPPPPQGPYISVITNRLAPPLPSTHFTYRVRVQGSTKPCFLFSFLIQSSKLEKIQLIMSK